MTATIQAAKNSLSNFADSLWTTVKAKFGLAAGGGVVTPGGTLRGFAHGGAIMASGRASWWSGVQKYAAGTARAHGTVFVAGEAGPEVVGHVNGRTEILNKSQLAQAIYSAVVSGMAQAVNALGVYLANHMTSCANAIVSAIGMSGVVGLSGVNYYPPAMAGGTILPYEVAAQLERTGAELQRTLNANNEDLIQTLISVIGAQTSAIVSAIQVHGSRSGGSRGLSAQQVVDEINRRTQMFSASPLKGI